MTKAKFLALLNYHKSIVTCLVIGDATTHDDEAHNKRFFGVFMCYRDTMQRSMLTYCQDEKKIKEELAKYEKWFNQWKEADHKKAFSTL